MFRVPKHPKWDRDDVIGLYRGALRRSPTDAEAEQLRDELNRTGNVHGAIADMLASHEFGIMMLAELVNEHISASPRSPTFFLHVPKTAGTAFRIALTDAYGVPAFMLYQHTTWQGFDLDQQMRFWPLWVGHAPVAAFPPTHRGISVLREPRSRILSLYRQREEELFRKIPQHRRPQDGASAGGAREVVSADRPFAEWVPRIDSALQWFLESPDDADMRLWNGLYRAKYLRELSDGAIRTSLASTMTRFDALAWSHDTVAMQRAIAIATGKPDIDLAKRENEFQVVPTTKPTVLTKADLAELNRIAEQERPLIDAASEAGLIEPLDSDVAQELFETTARRLHFTFE